MDGEISARLMKLAGRHPALDRLWVFLARYLIVLLGLGFLWAAWQVQSYDRMSGARFLLTGLAAVIVNETVSWGIAYIHFRPRPFVANHLTPLVRIAPGMKSFPSDHAVISFSLATMIASVWFVVGLPSMSAALCAAALVSVARVVCGVHYPSDVLVGAVLGILGTILVIFGATLYVGIA